MCWIRCSWHLHSRETLRPRQLPHPCKMCRRLLMNIGRRAHQTMPTIQRLLRKRHLTLPLRRRYLPLHKLRKTLNIPQRLLIGCLVATLALLLYIIRRLRKLELSSTSKHACRRWRQQLLLRLPLLLKRLIILAPHRLIIPGSAFLARLILLA